MPLLPLGLTRGGIAPLSKHPDLCNVCRVGERLLEVTVLFADAGGYTLCLVDKGNRGGICNFLAQNFIRSFSKQASGLYT